MIVFQNLKLKIVFALSIVLFTVATSAGDRWEGAHYVNMGSSFAAGAGVGMSVSDAPDQCLRSDVNYAALLAQALGLRLTDVSCSGAKTEHLLSAWSDRSLPPQLDALTADTKLITITVGGNDLHYVTNLFANDCSEDGKFVIEGRALPCFERTPVGDEDYDKVRQNFEAIMSVIKARAPGAEVVFVQYLTLVPDQPCPEAPLSSEEAARIKTIGLRLAEVTAEIAEKNGARVLPMDVSSREHTACDAEPWTIGAAKVHDNADGLLWHPNRRGHEVIAQALEKLLQ